MRVAILFAAMTALGTYTACKQDNKTGQSATQNTPALKRDSWVNAGCELITDAEIERIFEIQAKAVYLNSRPLPDQTFCLRTWKKVDWKERENSNEKNPDAWFNPENRLVVQLFDHVLAEGATAQMEGLRRDRRDTYPTDVTGVGEDALWSPSSLTLLVRKGKFLLHITLDVFDKSEENLPKAREVAALALEKF
jgi:hypothetical protein